ncbi:hypothetical protein OXYTRIMIC_336 [Oxytricha trifallax]|uniref:Uncharacterized protein n=1 Tax=Oxytricha trifallax TaxID=1172189 RepID=A0A073HZ26_9SPIT|nr:hypothetical protein OXYTRIMIC_336 [Oxytricha trifallax]
MDSLSNQQSEQSYCNVEDQEQQEQEQFFESLNASCNLCGQELNGDWSIQKLNGLDNFNSKVLTDIINGYFIGNQQDGFIKVFCKECWTHEILQLDFIDDIIQQYKNEIKSQAQDSQNQHNLLRNELKLSQDKLNDMTRRYWQEQAQKNMLQESMNVQAEDIKDLVSKCSKQKQDIADFEQQIDNDSTQLNEKDQIIGDLEDQVEVLKNQAKEMDQQLESHLKYSHIIDIIQYSETRITENAKINNEMLQQCVDKLNQISPFKLNINLDIQQLEFQEKVQNAIKDSMQIYERTQKEQVNKNLQSIKDFTKIVFEHQDGMAKAYESTIQSLTKMGDGNSKKMAEQLQGKVNEFRIDQLLEIISELDKVVIQ